MPQKKRGPVDRLPIICAAGKPLAASGSTATTLKEYSKYELAEKLIREKKLRELGAGEAATPVIPESNQVKDILAPELNKSRFLEFKDRFYENLYCKKVPLGKPTTGNSKPDHVSNESVTFGRAYEKADSLYDVALPNKSPDQVMREYIRWHDKYRLSHGDYYPSERKTRSYNKNFDPERVYGVVIKADHTGENVKGVLQSSAYKGPFIIGKTQEEFLRQNKSMLGKALNRDETSRPPEKVYGRLTVVDECDVKKLLNSVVRPEEISQNANETTYRAFSSDLFNSPVDCRRAAGVMESNYPLKNAVKFYAENLGEETRVKHLISPTIPIHFGLSHRDFLVPRPKEEIRRIFTKAGFDLKDDEHFEKIWQEAVKEWTSFGDDVSIEAFKFALHKIENESK